MAVVVSAADASAAAARLQQRTSPSGGDGPLNGTSSSGFTSGSGTKHNSYGGGVMSGKFNSRGGAASTSPLSRSSGGQSRQTPDSSRSHSGARDAEPGGVAAQRGRTPHWQAAWAAKQPARHVVTTFACGPAGAAIAAMPPAEAVACALQQLDQMFGAF